MKALTVSIAVAAMSVGIGVGISMARQPQAPAPIEVETVNDDTPLLVVVTEEPATPSPTLSIRPPQQSAVIRTPSEPWASPEISAGGNTGGSIVRPTERPSRAPRTPSTTITPNP
jgi:hypothetical protein